MSEIILHHYPQSPVTEKVRIGLGIKGLAWRSVEVPRIPPKPNLMPLTGGYRRAPVMQIGADVYCDSQCVLRELERRFPEPTFYPGGAGGMVWGISRWTDGELMDHVVGLVLGAALENLPPEFAADRGRLYFGPNYDLAAKRADLPHILAQIRVALGWMDDRVSGRKFMLGDRPGLPDALCYYLVWFIRGRWENGPEFLSQFPALTEWETRMRAIGHGEVRDMEAEAALDIAAAALPETEEAEDPYDPQGLEPGMTVSVVPDVDGGDPPVTGPIRAVGRETISILHENDRVGEVCIHFPRAGYRVTPE